MAFYHTGACKQGVALFLGERNLGKVVFKGSLSYGLPLC